MLPVERAVRDEHARPACTLVERDRAGCIPEDLAGSDDGSLVTNEPDGPVLFTVERGFDPGVVVGAHRTNESGATCMPDDGFREAFRLACLRRRGSSKVRRGNAVVL